MQMIQTSYGYLSKTEAYIIGRLDKKHHAHLHKCHQKCRKTRVMVWHNPKYQTHKSKQRIVHIKNGKTHES